MILWPGRTWEPHWRTGPGDKSPTSQTWGLSGEKDTSLIPLSHHSRRRPPPCPRPCFTFLWLTFLSTLGLFIITAPLKTQASFSLLSCILFSVNHSGDTTCLPASFRCSSVVYSQDMTRLSLQRWRWRSVFPVQPCNSKLSQKVAMPGQCGPWCEPWLSVTRRPHTPPSSSRRQFL